MSSTWTPETSGSSSRSRRSSTSAGTSRGETPTRLSSRSTICATCWPRRQAAGVVPAGPPSSTHPRRPVRPAGRAADVLHPRARPLAPRRRRPRRRLVDRRVTAALAPGNYGDTVIAEPFTLGESERQFAVCALNRAQPTDRSATRSSSFRGGSFQGVAPFVVSAFTSSQVRLPWGRVGFCAGGCAYARGVHAGTPTRSQRPNRERLPPPALARERRAARPGLSPGSYSRIISP